MFNEKDFGICQPTVFTFQITLQKFFYIQIAEMVLFGICLIAIGYLLRWAMEKKGTK